MVHINDPLDTCVHDTCVHIHVCTIHKLYMCARSNPPWNYKRLKLEFHQKFYPMHLVPRRRPVRDDVQPTHVRDWAPPGWHWEVLLGGARRLMRNLAPGPVVGPDLV